MLNYESTKMLVEKISTNCIVIDLTLEYGTSYVGAKYGVMLEGDVLNDNLIERLDKYEPYIILPTGFKKIFYEFKRNEKKYYMRSVRNSYFSLDDDFTQYHPEYAFVEDFDRNEINKIIMKTIRALTVKQRKRTYMFFYKGLNTVQIAEIEKVKTQAIDASIGKALKHIKKNLEDNGYNEKSLGTYFERRKTL